MTPTPVRGEWFMVEVAVADGRRSAAWYVEALGLARLLEDPVGGFILLGGGGVRVALKERAAIGRDREAVRLVFRVDDLEAARTHLIGLGWDVSGSVENVTEGYRETRLHDPDGTPITLFQWTRGDRIHHRDTEGTERRTR